MGIESLEQRQLLAADAVDDVFTVNAYVSNGSFLGVTHNDTRTNQQLPLTITAVSPTALGTRVEISGDRPFVLPADHEYWSGHIYLYRL